MTDEPPEIPSDGDSPTYFDGKPAEPPSAPSLPSDEKPTFFDDEARRLLDPGTELPPDLAAEHQAVYLRRGDLVANRFQVVKLLGFGGMGAVYRVRDRILNEDRALKVMLPSLLRSETARQRFLSEVRISQKLNHDGIVRVHDLGEDPERGFRFFTMEYIEGQTLNRLLKERGGKLPVDEALDITRQLCDALEYAHQHTVHRDLKPQNVMVQPDGRIKVLDFGLAKLMSPGRMTRSSMALGTAYYQAPEQSVHLSELDQRADIYSLGVLLYQMLTAQIPLGRVKPPSAVIRGLPKALDDVTLKCIEPQPNDRYDTVADLRAGLDLVARPKRRALVSAVLAALILTGVAVAASLWTHYGQPEPIEPPAPVAAQSGPEARPPVPHEQPTPTEEPGQQEKVPEPEPPTVAQGPEPPSEPQREGEAPSEPSRPVVTASEASAAKIAAQKAQKAALTAGAETHAAEPLADARKLLKEAEAHDTLEAFPEAIAKYAEAEAAFGKAEQQAAAIAAEIAAVEKAQSTMDDAKEEADALEAKTWAKVRYDQAAKLEEDARTALSISDRVAAARLFNQAAERYGLAVTEAKEYGEAIVAAAVKAADEAKQVAQTDDVKRYASAELAEADGLMDQAEAAGSDYERAKGLYEKAAAKYAEALSVTPGRKQAEQERIAAEKEAEAERIAESKAAMETARDAARTAKNKIGDDERQYAEKEVGAGDTAWGAAEAGGTYAEAERQFKLAKASYDEAVRVTPGRVAAATLERAGQVQQKLEQEDGAMLEHEPIRMADAWDTKATEPDKAEAPAPEPEEAPLPDVVKVKFDTSKGPIVIEVHRDWAPNGVGRFLELVKMGYFNDCRFFRVVTQPKPFVVQWGIPGDPELAMKWWNTTIPDDKPKQSNVAGMVTFAAGQAPNSRSTQLFINLGDNKFLDRMGFAPIGQVVQGMEIVRKFNGQYQEQPTNQQMNLANKGNAWLDEKFPGLDYIKSTTILK